jgi:hypothetical protein
MAEALLQTVLWAGVAAAAVAVLVYRDALRRRMVEAGRTDAERIDAIRDNARFMIQQFQGLLDRAGAEEPTSFAQIPPLLEYYRRLEALAAATCPSVQECLGLAREASNYMRHHRLKGIFVHREASQLAAIVGRRNATEGK